MTEYAWDDIRKVFESGNWLGAAGRLGTALLIDVAIQQITDPAQRAKLVARLPAKQRKRAMEFIEAFASGFSPHLGGDGADAAARAGTTTRNAAPTTARRASRRRGTQKRNGAPGAARARSR